MILHFSMLAGYIIPFAGIIAPIVIWLVKKEEFPELEAHGKNAFNWILSSFIYTVVCALLVFVLIGIPLILILIVLCTVFPIIAGIKASSGEIWRYPLSIPFLSWDSSIE